MYSSDRRGAFLDFGIQVSRHSLRIAPVLRYLWSLRQLVAFCGLPNLDQLTPASFASPPSKAETSNIQHRTHTQIHTKPFPGARSSHSPSPPPLAFQMVHSHALLSLRKQDHRKNTSTPPPTPYLSQPTTASQLHHIQHPFTTLGRAS